MKIILNILIILFVSAVVAGGLSLVVNNTSITSGADGQPPAMIAAGTQSAAQRPAGPDGGDEGSVSLGSGLLQVLVTIAKLTGIGLVVLAVQKIIGLSLQRRPQAA